MFVHIILCEVAIGPSGNRRGLILFFVSGVTTTAAATGYSGIY